MAVVFKQKKISRITIAMAMFNRMCSYYSKFGVKDLVKKTKYLIGRNKIKDHKVQIVDALYKEALGKDLTGRIRPIILSKFS